MLQAVWERQLAASAGPDCGYPAAFDGVFVLGMVSGAGVHTEDGSPPPDGGNMKADVVAGTLKGKQPVQGVPTRVSLCIEGTLQKVGLGT